ncbi:unnamed protein product [Durusdinium trenchii]|uniref:Uncharacterized protein n=1 Tax=Durusdinium trenchii TaxID=1381693 RepID=A0ABP0P908_9DINO
MGPTWETSLRWMWKLAAVPTQLHLCKEQETAEPVEQERRGEFNTRRLWKLLWLWHSERGQTRKSSANSDEAQKAPRHQLQSFTETAPGAGLQFPKMTEMQDQ